MKITVARLGPPADHNGTVIATSAIAPATVPVFAEFDYTAPIGRAAMNADGSAELELEPGIVLDVAALEADKTIGIGFRVLAEHIEGDVRVIDRLELLAVGVSRDLIRRAK